MLNNVTDWFNKFSRRDYVKILVVIVVIGFIATQVIQICLLYVGTLNNDSGNMQVKPVAYTLDDTGGWEKYSEDTVDGNIENVRVKIIPYTPIEFEEGSLAQTINNHTLTRDLFGMAATQESLHTYKFILNSLPDDNISDVSELESFEDQVQVYLFQNYEVEPDSEAINEDFDGEKYKQLVDIEDSEYKHAIIKIDEDNITFDTSKQEVVLSDIDISARDKIIFSLDSNIYPRDVENSSAPSVDSIVPSEKATHIDFDYQHPNNILFEDTSGNNWYRVDFIYSPLVRENLSQYSSDIPNYKYSR